MAKIKYYIEPSAFDRGFEKAVEHYADWNTVLVDLGKGSDDVHQCYSLRDGHVNASPEYLEQCKEITVDNFKGLIEGHSINESYVIDGEIVTVVLSSLFDGDGLHIEVYDKLPNEVSISTDEDYKLVLDEVEMEKVANICGFDTLEVMEVVLGQNNAIMVPKADMDKIKYHD